MFSTRWFYGSHILILSYSCKKNRCVDGYMGLSSVQLLNRVQLFGTPWFTACQASLSITNSRSLPKLVSIELVMPSSHLILCCPLPLLPPIPPRIRVFSNESTLHMRWPKYWSFSFSISLSNEYSGLISFRIDWFDLLAVQGTLKRKLITFPELCPSALPLQVDSAWMYSMNLDKNCPQFPISLFVKCHNCHGAI